LSAPESTPEQQHSNDTSLAPSKDPVRSRNPLNPQNCGASMQSAQKCARCELRGAVRRGMRKQNTVWLPASACHPPLCAQPARNSRSRTRTPPGTISRSEISVRSGLPRSQSPSAQSPSPLSYALPLPPLPRCRVSRLAVPSARRAELPPCQHWAAPQRIHARGEGGERGSAIRPRARLTAAARTPSPFFSFSFLFLRRLRDGATGWLFSSVEYYEWVTPHRRRRAVWARECGARGCRRRRRRVLRQHPSPRA